MTLENLETDVVYAIRSSINKIVFTCESEERAILYADRVFPNWRTDAAPWTILRMTTTYEKVS
jgi:hypothetical protein